MNLDYICLVEEIVSDSETTAVNLALSPGGSAANTIYGLARLGIKTSFVGAIGDDAEGKKLLRNFKAAGVDTAHIRIKRGATTGLAFCFSSKQGQRAIYVLPGANNLLDADDVDLTYINRAQIVHFSSFAHEKQLNLQIELASNLTSSTKLSLSPGTLYARKGLKALTPLLEHSYIVFLNDDEIKLLTGKDFKAGAELLLKLGCHIVVVTLGKGIPLNDSRRVISYIRTQDSEYQVTTADKALASIESTGAGDAFACGFLFGILNNKTLYECGILGDIVARFAIKAPGGRKGFPTLTQLSSAYLKRTGAHI